MATYEYRCPADGAFDVSFPIGTAAARSRCPTCGADAARAVSTPLLVRTPRALAAAIGRAERSAEAPEVVSAIPVRPQAPPGRPADAARARLPRH
jgi:putative FmdB family regulatory protein